VFRCFTLLLSVAGSAVTGDDENGGYLTAENADYAQGLQH
jgi:hypothetical protein